MNRLQRAAVLTRLIKRLRDQESWCGETHIQKATFFLQELTDGHLGFAFTMYRYGPYSFDLRDDLTGLRADNILRLAAQLPYGPRMELTERSDYIQRLYPRTLAAHTNGIDMVAKWLGSKGVAELERWSTALYVIRKTGASVPRETIIGDIIRLKPHVSRADAAKAVEEVTRQAQKVSAGITR